MLTTSFGDVNGYDLQIRVIRKSRYRLSQDGSDPVDHLVVVGLVISVALLVLLGLPPVPRHEHRCDEAVDPVRDPSDDLLHVKLPCLCPVQLDMLYTSLGIKHLYEIKCN